MDLIVGGIDGKPVAERGIPVIERGREGLRGGAGISGMHGWTETGVFTGIVRWIC